MATIPVLQPVVERPILPTFDHAAALRMVDNARAEREARTARLNAANARARATVLADLMDRRRNDGLQRPKTR